MNTDERKEEFKRQFREAIDRYEDADPKCAFGAGMLIILSALRKHDGPTVPMQVALMHTALREVGEERGWHVGTNTDKP